MGGDDVSVELNIKKISSKHIEIVALILFFIVLISFTSIFDNGLFAHRDGPVNLNAGDMYTFAAYADVARFSSDMKENPAHLSGGFPDTVNFFPPIAGILAAQIGDFVGVESYDLIVHLNILFLILSAAIIYLFIIK